MAMAGAERDTAIEVVGVRQLLRALSKIDKDLQQNVRAASGEIASKLVSQSTSAAHTPQQQLVASGLKVRRDRVPVVRAGGTMRNGVLTKDVFYGAEFGGQRRPTTMQFQPHRRQLGYFFYPTARAHGREYANTWIAAVDKAFEAWRYRAPKT